MSNQFLGNSVNQVMSNQNINDSNKVVDERINEPDLFETDRSIKVDLFDPFGKASIIEDNLRAVFRILNNRRLNCNFSIVSSQNTRYLDMHKELIIRVNDKFNLTNKDRFRLDVPLSEPELESFAEFFITVLEKVCRYRF